MKAACRVAGLLAQVSTLFDEGDREASLQMVTSTQHSTESRERVRTLRAARVGAQRPVGDFLGLTSYSVRGVMTIAGQAGKPFCETHTMSPGATSGPYERLRADGGGVALAGERLEADAAAAERAGAAAAAPAADDTGTPFAGLAVLGRGRNAAVPAAVGRCFVVGWAAVGDSSAARIPSAVEPPRGAAACAAEAVPPAEASATVVEVAAAGVAVAASPTAADADGCRGTGRGRCFNRRSYRSSLMASRVAAAAAMRATASLLHQPTMPGARSSAACWRCLSVRMKRTALSAR